MSDVESTQEGEAPEQPTFDLTTLRRWVLLTRSRLRRRQKAINELNVFPVPDGDTGTNLFLTVDSAVRGWAQGSGRARSSSLSGAADASAHATLVSARGNSGVILSQLVRGAAEELAHARTPADVDGHMLARVLRRADGAAWGAVPQPVEGTILSVSRAAADAAEQCADEGGTLGEVARAAVQGGQQALGRTPGQLGPLGRPGVVDAGGAGYVVILESLRDVLSPARRAAAHDAEGVAELAHALDLLDEAGPDIGSELTLTDGPAAHGAVPSGAADPHGPATEVMYLLQESDEHRASVLRGELGALGDSVIVAGGPTLFTVHAHVDDVDAAVAAGGRAGTPVAVRTEPLRRADDAVGSADVRGCPDPTTDQHGEPGTGPVTVVAGVSGDGLVQLHRAAGARVVDASTDSPASTSAVTKVLRGCAPGPVVVLPNDEGTLEATRAAVAASPRAADIHIVATTSPAQGLAALAVFDPLADVASLVAEMEAAAVGTRHGAVRAVSRRTETPVGRARRGDLLGVVGTEVVAVDRSAAHVAGVVAERLLGPGGDLLTLVTGAGAPSGLAQAVGSAVRLRRRDIEVEIIDGGQKNVPLILGVG